ncbi:MAG: hypothetical protein ACLQBK_06915 [Candidatus Sulfotelmatobacter sp.]
MKFFCFVSLLVVFDSALTLAQTSPVPPSNRPLGPQTLSLAGTRSRFQLRPSSLSFNERGEKQVTVTNLGGSALDISSVAITGSETFSQMSTCGAVVEARKSCTISVTFRALKVGNFTGELVVGDGASHESVSLFGHFGP